MFTEDSREKYLLHAVGVVPAVVSTAVVPVVVSTAVVPACPQSGTGGDGNERGLGSDNDDSFGVVAVAMRNDSLSISINWTLSVSEGEFLSSLFVLVQHLTFFSFDFLPCIIGDRSIEYCSCAPVMQHTAAPSRTL